MAAALSYTQRGGPGQTWESINNLVPAETQRSEFMCLGMEEVTWENEPAHKIYTAQEKKQL